MLDDLTLIFLLKFLEAFFGCLREAIAAWRDGRK